MGGEPASAARRCSGAPARTPAAGVGWRSHPLPSRPGGGRNGCGCGAGHRSAAWRASMAPAHAQPPGRNQVCPVALPCGGALQLRLPRRGACSHPPAHHTAWTRACREAEQRARAAKLYDRQRQRFHRALLAAEDLEGADSSVFTAVSRKGQIFGPGTLGSAPGRLSGAGGPVGGRAGSGDGSSGTAGVDSHAGAGGGAEGDVATLAAAGPLATADAQDGRCAADAADALSPAAMHTCWRSRQPSLLPINPPCAALCMPAPCSYDLEESAHAFDPASWDEDTRKQWDAFVASSKVGAGAAVQAWADLRRCTRTPAGRLLAAHRALRSRHSRRRCR